MNDTYPGRTHDSAELRVARLLFYGGTLVVAESRFRYAAGLTLGEMMFLAATGLCLIAMLRGQDFVKVPLPLTAAVCVFAFGGVISSTDAASPQSSAFQLVHAIYVVLLWPAVGAMVIRTRRQLATAMTLWTISAAIDGFAAISQLFGLHLLGITREGDRMTGFTTHPNDLGGVTAITLVPALWLATSAEQSQTILLSAMRWIPAALIAAGLALSGSVAGLLGASVAVLVWLSSPVVRAPARAAVAGAVVAAIATVAVAGGRVSSPVQRLAQVATATSQTGGSAQDRLAVAQQALPRIKRDPFVGTGLDTADSGVTIVSHGYTTPYQVHGLPLAAWFQAGIFGMLGLIGALAVFAVIGWQGIGSASTVDDQVLALALLAAFVGFVIVTMTQPMVFQQYGWISAVFIVAWALRIDARYVDAREENGSGDAGPIGRGEPHLTGRMPAPT